MSEAVLSDPNTYVFISIPVPLLHDRRVSRVDAAVYGAIFSRSRLNVNAGEAGVHLSLRQIGELAGTDKRSAARSRDRLLDLGYLQRAGARRSTPFQRGTDALLPRIPAEGRGQRFVRDGMRAVIVSDDDGDEKKGGGGAAHPGVGVVPTGGGGAAHPGVGVVPTLRDPVDPPEDQEEDERNASASRCGADGGTPSVAGGEEVQTPLPDEGNEAAAEEAAAEAKSGSRPTGRPRRKVLAADAELLRRPSERPELNRWREKLSGRGTRGWSARDVVGYFACRFREVRGEESPEFFATTEHLFNRFASNVSKYVKRWLAGDYRRAVELADLILERASAHGMPVKLGYFFTPANEAPALRLRETPRRTGRRPETPAERNDRGGADTPENQERIAKLREEFIAEERRRDEAEQEVRRDDRRSA